MVATPRSKSPARAARRATRAGEACYERTTGPPVPWPCVVLLAGIAAAAALSIKPIAFAPPRSIAPAPLVSLPTLAVVRACLWFLHAHRLYLVTRVRKPYGMQLQFNGGSTLIPGVQYIAGRQRLVTFTIQTWALQTLYFALAAVATAYPDLWLAPRTTRWLFELLFAAAHLVSGVTTYVLVPTSCSRWKGALKDLPLLQVDQKFVHNANVAAMHVDAFLSDPRAARRRLLAVADLVDGCKSRSKRSSLTPVDDGRSGVAAAATSPRWRRRGDAAAASWIVGGQPSRRLAELGRRPRRRRDPALAEAAASPRLGARGRSGSRGRRDAATRARVDARRPAPRVRALGPRAPLRLLLRGLRVDALPLL
mmetsp:Transcript_21680/g.67964  ORF Transcript_21680/g.67964 Transcript_21680/m.67964 type:complete len:366 (+) Transcript_21680:495-1592(+)